MIVFTSPAKRKYVPDPQFDNLWLIDYYGSPHNHDPPAQKLKSTIRSELDRAALNSNDNTTVWFNVYAYYFHASFTYCFFFVLQYQKAVRNAPNPYDTSTVPANVDQVSAACREAKLELQPSHDDILNILANNTDGFVKELILLPFLATVCVHNKNLNLLSCQQSLYSLWME